MKGNVILSITVTCSDKEVLWGGACLQWSSVNDQRQQADQVATPQLLNCLLCLMKFVKRQSRSTKWKQLHFIILHFSLAVSLQWISFDKGLCNEPLAVTKSRQAMTSSSPVPRAPLFSLPCALPSGPPADSTAGSRAGAWWGWTPRAGHRSCTAGCWRSPAPCMPQTTDQLRTPTAGERKERIREMQRGKRVLTSHVRKCEDKKKRLRDW